MLLVVLACAVFAQATSEFMLAGLVPDIAADLGVTPLAAGSLTAAFAVGMVVGALYQTLSITAMFMLIVLAGNIFAAVFYASGGMTEVKTILTDYGIAGWQAIAFVMVLAFLGGFMLDLISIVLILIPIAMPLVVSYGVNELWFCVLFLIILQTSYLSPPMAPSIFYLRAIAPVELRLADMYRGVVPFIVLQVVTFLIVFIFPEVALWLPRVFYGN